jgi:hypothetical protein
MKTRNYIALLTASTALVHLSTSRANAQTPSFYPSPAAAGQHFEPKASAGEVQILANLPDKGVIVIGELGVQGGPGISVADMVATAQSEAMKRGADFVALAKPAAQSGAALGKMVPVGHGRSMFVANTPNQGSGSAAEPIEAAGGIRVIIGRFSKTTG